MISRIASVLLILCSMMLNVEAEWKCTYSATNLNTRYTDWFKLTVNTQSVKKDVYPQRSSVFFTDVPHDYAVGISYVQKNRSSSNWALWSLSTVSLNIDSSALEGSHLTKDNNWRITWTCRKDENADDAATSGSGDTGNTNCATCGGSLKPPGVQGRPLPWGTSELRKLSQTCSELFPCLATLYCDGTCKSKKEIASTCSNAIECSSGFCVQDRCRKSGEPI